MVYKPPVELVNLMQKLLAEEAKRFFQNIGIQHSHTIRFNSLRGQSEVLQIFLQEQGFEFEAVPEYKNIFRLKYQPYPIGKSLSHFLGHIYVQDLASMLPPLVLDPQPGQTVLDMSAAPGSKTTQMAVLMENRGVIIANDVVQKRLQALINNLQRLGILNCAVLKNYGESFGKNYFETFDKILLDPACSGLGTLHKSPEVLSWWTTNHCLRLAVNQKRMMLSAIKALKPGGELVYSTCTLTPWENEDIIDYALNHFPVKLEKIDIPTLITRSGLTEFDGKKYDSSMCLALRLYPFENNTEGFFIAKLRKTAVMKNKKVFTSRRPLHVNFIMEKSSPVKKYLDYFSIHFGIDRQIFQKYAYFVAKSITAVSKEVANFKFISRPLKTGLTIAKPLTYIGKLTTEGILLFGEFAQKNVINFGDYSLLEKFVNRDIMDISNVGNNQQLIRFGDLTIGYGLVDGGKLKSQFPKAGWIFELTKN